VFSRDIVFSRDALAERDGREYPQFCRGADARSASASRLNGFVMTLCMYVHMYIIPGDLRQVKKTTNNLARRTTVERNGNECSRRIRSDKHLALRTTGFGKALQHLGSDLFNTQIGVDDAVIFTVGGAVPEDGPGGRVKLHILAGIVPVGIGR